MANHRTVFTVEMRMTIACKISCSPSLRWDVFGVKVMINGEIRNVVNRPTEKTLAESEGNMKDSPYFLTSN